MTQIELVDEQITAIIIADLKQAFEATFTDVMNGVDQDYGLLASIQRVLEYYMGKSEYDQWVRLTFPPSF